MLSLRRLLLGIVGLCCVTIALIILYQVDGELKNVTGPGGWQAAEKGGGKPREIFFYSAYHDTRFWARGRNYHYVRILAVIKSDVSRRYFCQLFMDGGLPRPIVVEADLQKIWVDQWDRSPPSRYYTPYILSCPVPRNVTETGFSPKSVSVVTEPCSCAYNRFVLPQPANTKAGSVSKRKGFVVCVKGVDFGDEDISHRLVEWLELQFLLGADNVFLYMFRVNDKVELLLRFYQRFRNVTLRRITLPGDDEPDRISPRREYLRRHLWQKRRHEIIPYNDCYYRHIPTHKFVALLDLDEVIVPVKGRSWNDIIDNIIDEDEMALANFASFAFPNVYYFTNKEFSTHLENDVASDTERLYFTDHTMRSANFTKPGFAVKSFFPVNNSIALFNHYTLVPLHGRIRKCALVGSHIARMQHYRKTCPLKMDDACRDNYFKFKINDPILEKYRPQLVERINDVKKDLSSKYLLTL